MAKITRNVVAIRDLYQQNKMSTQASQALLYPLGSAMSEAAIKKLDEFYENVGAPQRVLSGRGNQFTSKK